MTTIDLTGQHPPLSPKPEKQPPLAMRGLRLAFSKLGPIFPGPFGNLAYRLWFTPQRKRQSGAERKLLDSAAETYQLNVAKCKVPVYVWGESGPTILLVHGWAGRTSQFREFVQPLVDKGFRVIGFDAPGHGTAEGRTTDLDQIRFIMATIAANETKIYGVIAHSFGAISTAFAMASGLVAERVVLVNAACRYQALVRTFQKMLHLPEPVLEKMTAKTRHNFAHWPRDIEAMMDVDRNPPDLPLETLVIHDHDDPVVSLEQGELIAKTWPNAQWMTTRGMGHSKILSSKDVVDRVCHFLSST